MTSAQRDRRQPGDLQREALRLAVRYRALLAGGLTVLAVVGALGILAPAAPARAVTVVAARDLPAGVLLAPGDVTVTSLPSEALTEGTLTDPAAAVGQVLAGAVRHGEVLTDVRLLGGGALRGLARGQVAAPVRLADPGVTALLHPGDRVDVLVSPAVGAGPGTGSAAAVTVATLVAADLTVLTVTDPATAGGGPSVTPTDGGLVVLSVTPTAALRLAGAAATGRLSVDLRPPEEAGSR